MTDCTCTTVYTLRPVQSEVKAILREYIGQFSRTAISKNIFFTILENFWK